MYVRQTFVCKFRDFQKNVFSADITPNIINLSRVTKFTVLFLALIFIFNFNLFKFSAAILEKRLLKCTFYSRTSRSFPTQIPTLKFDRAMFQLPLELEIFKLQFE